MLKIIVLYLHRYFKKTDKSKSATTTTTTVDSHDETLNLNIIPPSTELGVDQGTQSVMKNVSDIDDEMECDSDRDFIVNSSSDDEMLNTIQKSKSNIL